MIFENEKKILKIIKYAPSVFILLVSIIILTIQFIEKNNTFQKEKIKIQNEYIERNKELIKDRVNEVYTYIQNEKKSTEEDLKDSLSLAINNAHAIAQTIYKNNKDKDPKFVKKLIIDALRNIRFNDGRGYYFIYDKKGVNHLLPYNRELEGKSFWNHKDAKGIPIVRQMIEVLKTKDESYCQWHWYNPLKPDVQKRKIGLVKNFEPFDWFIGTGEYVEDFEKDIQNRILKHIQNIRFGKSGYIFIINYDSIYLSHIRKEFINQNAVTNNDTIEIKKVIKDLIEISKNGQGYYAYTQNKKPGVEKPINKTSYVKGLNEWSWMIGTGFYQDDMEKSIQDRKAYLDQDFKKRLVQTIQIELLLVFILLLFSIYFSKILQNIFEKYTKDIEHHIETNNKQQNMLAYQSKMAAMGEMIGNIAHQWRQPLSAISTTSTGLKLQKEMNMLDDKFLLKSLNDINAAAQFLSSTIDDFRNFFKVNKEKSIFSIKDILKKSISLVSAQFKNHDIAIIENIEDIKITNFQNELIQVVINILNNAKDELVKKHKDSKKIILINTQILEDTLIIEIKDNAQGIPLDILDRIFEPYFTTKHKRQGTGVGLFMSREIINKNMKGNIKAYNSTFVYQNCEYNGAVFRITLPLNTTNLNKEH
ncbi:MAG: cache domain-containing protein [Arcobacter sp.]|uniref:sensor histidine kinase n=1 Tax=Arcobacter sp. TaxID=1872629 RepID=UPI003B001DD0